MLSEHISRRRAMAIAGTTITGSLAGCTADNGDGITVLLLLPFSGPAQSLGEGMAEGARIAIEESNVDTEMNIIERDTATDPQQSLNELESAIEREDVDFVIGPVSTAVANAIRDTVEQNEVIWINCNSGSNALAQEECMRYHFRPSFSNWQQSYPFGEWISENTDHEEAVVLAADYGGGHEHAEGFIDGFEAQGGEVINEAYPPLGTDDYSAELTSIENENPDVVYTFVYGLDEVNFVTQYDEFGLKEDIPLVQAWGPTQDILPEIGESAEGITSFCHYTPMWNIPPNEEFRSLWIDEHGNLPSEWNVQGSESSNLMLEAIGAVDGDISDTNEVIETLNGIEWTGPRGDRALDPTNNNVILDMQVRETVAAEDPVGNEYQNEVIDVVEDVQLDPSGCNL